MPIDLPPPLPFHQLGTADVPNSSDKYAANFDLNDATKDATAPTLASPDASPCAICGRTAISASSTRRSLRQ